MNAFSRITASTAILLISCLTLSIDAHSAHEEDSSADFLTTHMDKEHHIQVHTILLPARKDYLRIGPLEVSLFILMCVCD
jgi:hypothetical protein